MHISQSCKKNLFGLFFGTSVRCPWIFCYYGSRLPLEINVHSRLTSSSIDLDHCFFGHVEMRVRKIVLIRTVSPCELWMKRAFTIKRGNWRDEMCANRASGGLAALGGLGGSRGLGSARRVCKDDQGIQQSMTSSRVSPVQLARSGGVLGTLVKIK